MTPRRWILAALAAAALFLLLGRVLARTYVDYQWYASLDAADVWRAKAGATAVMLLATWLAASLFIFANLYAVRHSVVSLVLPRRVANLEIGEEVPRSYLTAAVVTLSILLGALLTMPQVDWSSAVAAFSHAPFGERDPYLDRDLGFFVHWLPFEMRLHTWTLISVFIVAALVLFLYALTPSLRWERGSLYVSAYVRRHLTVLAGVLLVMLAWSYRLDRFMLVVEGSGPDYAFTWLDHILGLPGSLVLSVSTLAAAVVVIWSGWTGQIRLAFSAITGVLVLALLVRQVAPYLVERSDEDRDPRVRERPYLATRAGYTRQAFAVDRIEPADSLTQYGSLPQAARGISLWDPAAIEVAVERSRPVAVTGAEVGWRASASGDLVASVPERILPRGGWTLSRVLVTAVDEHGGLVRLPASGTDSPQDAPVLAPIVHDSATGHAILPDSQGVIAGMHLERSLDRLALAWSLQKPGLLFGELPGPRPIVVARRDVRERLRALVPFLEQGSGIVPMLAGDTLLWMVDLYAASSTYPLSLHISVAGNERSYFQHAGTALVNASTGYVRIVADSVTDPVARWWIDRFPSIFSRWQDVPPAIRAAVPPAYDGVYAQAAALARFGTRVDSDVPRRLPAPAAGSDSALIGLDAPFLLPGGATAIAHPLLVDETERVQGLVIGTGGVRRRTVWYPLSEPTPRWGAVVDRLRGDAPATSSQPNLARGAVRAVPVAGDIAFLQSAYVWRAQGAPTLAHVSVLLRDSVRVGATLSDIVGSTGDRPPLPPLAPPLTMQDLRARADSLYQTMREAMRRGDWTRFGQAFDALGRLLGGNR